MSVYLGFFSLVCRVWLHLTACECINGVCLVAAGRVLHC